MKFYQFKKQEVKVNKMLIIMCMVQVMYAQTPPDTQWMKTFGGDTIDWATFVQQTTDTGYMVLALTMSYSAGDYDIWLIKTNENGDTLWTKTLGGNSRDAGFSFQQTHDNGYIIAGYTYSYGAGGCDAYLIKTDENGDTLWTRTYGGTINDEARSVHQTHDGGYIITGGTMSYAVNAKDIYLIKTDSNGDTLWTKTFGGIYYFSEGREVQQTADSGYIIAGYTRKYAGTNDYDIYIIKTDKNGDTLWTRIYGGSQWDLANSVKETMDGNYIIAAQTKSSGTGMYDVWIIKLNPDGDTLWTKTFGGVNDDWAKYIQETQDTNYIIAGCTESYGAGGVDIWIIKIDRDGNLLWTKTIGGVNNDWGNCVQYTVDGGYIITGRTESFGAGNSDAYLIKLEPELAVNEDKFFEKQENKFFVFKDKLLFDISEAKFFNFSIYKEDGSVLKNLYHTFINGEKFKLNLNNLKSGIYFIKLRIDNQSYRFKFIKF